MNALEGPLVLTANFYMPIPKSFSNVMAAKAETGRLLPDKRPDLDNLTKLLLDGLNGVCWKDDNQVISLHAHKYYSEEPRTWVCIEQLDADMARVGKNEEDLVG